MIFSLAYNIIKLTKEFLEAPRCTYRYKKKIDLGYTTENISGVHVLSGLK